MKWGALFAALFAASFGCAGSAGATAIPIDTMSLDGGHITIDEFSDHYDVHNNAIGLYIFALAVSNPNPSAQSFRTGWSATTGLLDLNTGTLLPVNAYYSNDADPDPLSDTHLPGPITQAILDNLIGPGGSSIDEFRFVATPASVAGVLLINSDGTQFSFNSTTPLPAALPLFAGGLGFVAFLARRKTRRRPIAFN